LRERVALNSVTVLHCGAGLRETHAFALFAAAVAVARGKNTNVVSHL
jgi:hypothetical protein